MASRRWILALAPALLLAPRLAVAQELSVEAILQSIGDAFAPAAGLAADTAKSVSNLKPSMFTKTERPTVIEGISTFESELEALNMRQGTLVADIGDYVASVRTHGFSEVEHPPMWRSITTELRHVARQVAVVQAEQAKASWLKKTLSPEQDQQLRDVLIARGALIEKLSSLPAPRTPIEIDKLAALHARYVELRKQLYALREALAKAKARFA